LILRLFLEIQVLVVAPVQPDERATSWPAIRVDLYEIKEFSPLREIAQRDDITDGFPILIDPMEAQWNKLAIVYFQNRQFFRSVTVK
jgi:hypothetical protein